MTLLQACRITGLIFYIEYWRGRLPAAFGLTTAGRLGRDGVPAGLAVLRLRGSLAGLSRGVLVAVPAAAATRPSPAAPSRAGAVGTRPRPE